MSRRQVTLLDVLLYQLEQDERRIEEQAEMAQTSEPGRDDSIPDTIDDYIAQQSRDPAWAEAFAQAQRELDEWLMTAERSDDDGQQ